MATFFNHSDGTYTLTEECIASFIWYRGALCVAYFEKKSMELYVTHEIIDLKPDYRFLKNLTRQLNIKEIIASGPTQFLRVIMELANLPSNTDPNLYKVNLKNPVTSSDFVVYPNDLKSISNNRYRIMKLYLPGMPRDITDFDRKLFLEATLPLHSELVIQCIGNMLNYLEANWRYIFLQNDPNPIISNINVYHIDSHLLIDEKTFLALQIFSPTKYHPSGFKRGIDATEELSIYSLFNRCSSKIGQAELMVIMQQPLRDLNEITLRQSTIECIINQLNTPCIRIMRKNLANMYNSAEVFLNLCRQPTKIAEWKRFRESVSSIYHICRLADDLSKNCRSFFNVLSADIGKSNVENILTMLDALIDMEKSIQLNEFTIRTGCDTVLDKMKKELLEIRSKIEDDLEDQVQSLPENIENLSVQYLKELGFFIGYPKASPDTTENIINIFNKFYFKFVHDDNNQLFFKSDLLESANKTFNILHSEIRVREEKYCNKLITALRENIAEIQKLTRLCAKIDCLISMAIVAKEINLIKPKLTTDKVIEITNGKHILLDQQTNIVPIDTIINPDNKNILTILCAPNSCGKSIYLKQVGLIAYLAHIGSFVPCTSAKICLLDSIYSRIYNAETVHYNASTYLVELQQFSNIIRNSSNCSLVLIDEFGKGTSVDEGKALLTASLENLAKRAEHVPFTIVSTHYLDLYDLMAIKNNVSYKTIEIKRQSDGTIKSTFKIVPGHCMETYATECPEMKKFLPEISNSVSLINAEYYDAVQKLKIDIAMTVLDQYILKNSISVSDVKTIMKIKNL